MKLYLEGLGDRDVVTDKDQIIWFMDQIVKRKSKAEATKFWLSFRESYFDALIKAEAYELLNYIKTKATDAKLKRRQEWRKKSKEKAEKEIKNMEIFLEQCKIKRELIDLIRLN